MLTAARAFIVLTTEYRSSVLWIFLFRPSIVSMLVFPLSKMHGTSSNAEDGIKVLIPDLLATLNALAHRGELFPNALSNLPLGLGHVLHVKPIKETLIDCHKHGDLFTDPQGFILWLLEHLPDTSSAFECPPGLLIQSSPKTGKCLQLLELRV
jgi:hypothetical protein